MRVYVAGPMKLGPWTDNLRQALTAADELLKAGHAPFVPHLSYFHELLYPNDYELWLALDFEWIKVCDAVVRLPGESAGADREEAFAEEHGIPVFYDVNTFMPWAEARQRASS